MIDYAFFRVIAIKDVLEALNIEVNKKGKFVCPAHNDNSPSASIYAKDDTRWHCFACGAGGTAIDLIMDIHKCDINEACIILDNLGFKGGILEGSYLSKEAFAPPIINFKDLKTIGLKNNPFDEQTICVYAPDPNNENRIIKTLHRYTVIGPKETSDYLSSLEVASGIIINKTQDYINNLNNYVKGIKRNFPELDASAISYMEETTNKNIAYYKEIITKFQEYNRFLAETEKTLGLDISLSAQLEEEFTKE